MICVQCPAVAAFSAALTLGIAAVTAQGQSTERYKLSAENAQAHNAFGTSVAVAGRTAVVGTPASGGTGPGAVYLFDVETGSPLTRLIADDAAGSDWFGYSAAIEGRLAVVGSMKDTHSGRDRAGSAYVFDVVTGQQISKLTAPDAWSYDDFGVSVDISGHTAIVGATSDDDRGLQSGSAYIFDVTTGLQTAKLTADDGSSWDLFGQAVAIEGGIAAVGAWLDGDDDGRAFGSAYLFDVSTGTQLAKLTASDAGANDLFGISVDISGDVLIVGARGSDDSGNNAGSAYLFDIRDPLNPIEMAKVTASDAGAGDLFGTSVAIDGNTALVGALHHRFDGPTVGGAYLFDVTDLAEPQEIARFKATDAEEHDWFGGAVAIAGEAALIGAGGGDDMGPNSGSAYLFVVPEPGCIPALLAGMMAATSRRRLGEKATSS